MTWRAWSPPAIPWPLERWYTVAEVAAQLGRSSSRVLTLIKRHNLPRRKVRQGKHPRRVVEVKGTTLRRLQEITRR
jgi:hypothetical protein